MAEFLAIVGTISTVIGIVDPLITRLTQLGMRLRIYKGYENIFRCVISQLSDISHKLENIRSLLSSVIYAIDSRVSNNLKKDVELIDAKLRSVASKANDLEKLFNHLNGKPRALRLFHKMRYMLFSDMFTSDIEEISLVVKEASTLCSTLTGSLGILHHMSLPESESSTPFDGVYSVPYPQSHTSTRFTISTQFETPQTQEDHIKLAIFNMGSHRQQSISAVVGVEGMGGIGKTTTLIALGWEPDVRERFNDGIYFMQFGMDSDEHRFRKELARIVRQTGGNYEAGAICRADSSSEAAERAASRFRDRTALFLCDDLWNTNNSPNGFVDDLKRLLHLSKNSCMMITTRDKEIAKRAGLPIEFHPREVHGLESLNILLNAANNFVAPGVGPSLNAEKHLNSLHRILTKCCGVPLTLAVTGSAIADLCAVSFGSWAVALNKYETEYRSNSLQVIHGRVEGYPDNFEKTIRVSLQVADSMSCFELKPSVLLLRFCVFEKQTIVPNSILLHLWYKLHVDSAQMTTNRLVHMNLLTRAVDRNHESIGVSLHDHVLDYCHLEAKHLGLFAECHRSLLLSFMPSSTSYDDLQSNLSFRDLEPTRLAEITRPWWSIAHTEGFGFLSENLIRFLVRANLIMEAIGIQTNARWIELRFRLSGILAVLGDFKNLIDALQSHSTEPRIANVIHYLCVIRDMCSDIHSILQGDISELTSQIHGRLKGLQDSYGLLRRLIQTSEEMTIHSWLRPLSCQWGGPFGSRFVEIALGEESFNHYSTVDWLRGIVIMAAGSSVSEIDLQARKVIRHRNLQGEAIAITKDGEFVALIQWEEKIISVWDRIGERKLWERRDVIKREVPSSSSDFEPRFPLAYFVFKAAWSADRGFLVLGGEVQAQRSMYTPDGEGWILCLCGTTGETIFEKMNAHEKLVIALGASSDGSRIISGSDDGWIKLWNVHSGELLWKSRHSILNGVSSVAMRADLSLVASTGEENMIRLWEPLNDKSPIDIKEDHNFALDMQSLVFSDNGNYLAAALYRGMEIHRVDEDDVQVFFRATTSGDLKSIAIIDDGGFAVATGCFGGRNVLWFWDTAKYIDQPHELDLLSGQKSSLLFLSKGRQVLSVGGGELVLWDPEKGSQHRLHSFRKCRKDLGAVGDGGKTVVTVASYSSYICWWDGHTGALLHEGSHGSGKSAVKAIALTSDGERAVTICNEGILCIWDKFGSLICIIDTNMSNELQYPELSISDNGRRVAVCSSSQLQFWEPPFHDPIKTLRLENSIWSLCLSSYGDLVLSGHEDGTIQIQQWASEQVVWQQVGAHEARVSCVSMGDECRCIVSGGWDNKVKLWHSRKESLNAVISDLVDGVIMPVEFEMEFKLVASVTIPHHPHTIAYYGDDCLSGKEQVAVGDERGNVFFYELVRI